MLVMHLITNTMLAGLWCVEVVLKHERGLDSIECFFIKIFSIIIAR